MAWQAAMRSFAALRMTGVLRRAPRAIRPSALSARVIAGGEGGDPRVSAGRERWAAVLAAETSRAYQTPPLLTIASQWGPSSPPLRGGEDARANDGRGSPRYTRCKTRLGELLADMLILLELLLQPGERLITVIANDGDAKKASFSGEARTKWVSTLGGH
jgi:hypothetical protein